MACGVGRQLVELRWSEDTMLAADMIVGVVMIVVVVIVHLIDGSTIKGY